VHFHDITSYPDEVNACGVVARLLDGLGFRFRWATEGLRESDYDFLPSGGRNSISVMITHIWGLMNWIHLHVHGSEATRPESVEETCDHTLELIASIRRDVITLGDEKLQDLTIEGLPFWHLINGPIADAVSHVGQINFVRRLTGNPPANANVFTGRPPPEI
jgi:hypothetical protein